MRSRLSILFISMLLLLSMSTGCIGNMGLSGKVREFNLETTQDRWGRELLFVALHIFPGAHVHGSGSSRMIWRSSRRDSSSIGSWVPASGGGCSQAKAAHAERPSATQTSSQRLTGSGLLRDDPRTGGGAGTPPAHGRAENQG